jgi:RHS repeat-associated protein
MRALLTQGGGTIQSDYEPYGKQIGGAVAGERKAYIDRENDAETGNTNMGVRSEEPEEGRFLSVDPLWERYPWQSPYVYADNNPMRLKDPWGEQGWEEALGAYAAEAAASAVLAALTQYALTQSLQPVPMRSLSVDVPAARDLTPHAVPVQLGNGATVPLPPAIQYDAGSAFGWGIVLMAAGHEDGPDEPGMPPPTAGPAGERNPAQDKMLTEKEIKLLVKGGENIHVIKGKTRTGRIDLYKDAEGNIYVKGKGGKGPGDPLGININDYK